MQHNSCHFNTEIRIFRYLDSVFKYVVGMRIASSMAAWILQSVPFENVTTLEVSEA